MSSSNLLGDFSLYLMMDIISSYIKTAVEEKADKEHTHTKSGITDLRRRVKKSRKIDRRALQLLDH